VIVDLGTAFSVRTDDARGVLVAVTSGRVTLAADSTPTRTLELAAGDAGVLDRVSGATRNDAVAVDDAIAWTAGALVFRDAPFDDVASAMRRWHGIELLADGTVRAARLTATFRSESRATVLETIALSYGARLVTQGDTVRLLMSGSGRAPQ
jgi:transmembrane sensor